MKCSYGHNNQQRSWDQSAETILNIESKYLEDLLEIELIKSKCTTNEFEQMKSDKDVRFIQYLYFVGIPRINLSEILLYVTSDTPFAWLHSYSFI